MKNAKKLTMISFTRFFRLLFSAIIGIINNVQVSAFLYDRSFVRSNDRIEKSGLFFCNDTFPVYEAGKRKMAC